MKQEYNDLAKYRIEKAKNTLSDAQKFMGKATLESTVNRIYYAMFYAVNALLIANGLSSSKHSGTRALFNKDFIKKGLIGKKFGEFYTEMFDRRQKADYQDYTKFVQKDVEQWLRKAEAFINEIERCLSHSLNK